MKFTVKQSKTRLSFQHKGGGGGGKEGYNLRIKLCNILNLKFHLKWNANLQESWV